MYRIRGFQITDGTLEHYSGTECDIMIPVGVTEIGKNAFAKCEDLTSVTISDSVTKIGRSAFAGCKKLTKLFVPASVTTICGAIFELAAHEVQITYTGASSDWIPMMKQEEEKVEYFQDDGWHHGHGLHIKYMSYIPIFYSQYPDFKCEVYCQGDGKTLEYRHEEPLPNRDLGSYDDSAEAMRRAYEESQRKK